MTAQRSESSTSTLGRPVGPDRVFAAAVRAGRGTALDALVVERALAVAARRPANCFVTINVDPIDLGTPEMDRVLAQRDLRGLVFELTEHYPFDDADAIQRALAQLRRRARSSRSRGAAQADPRAEARDPEARSRPRHERSSRCSASWPRASMRGCSQRASTIAAGSKASWRWSGSSTRSPTPAITA